MCASVLAVFLDKDLSEDIIQDCWETNVNCKAWPVGDKLKNFVHKVWSSYELPMVCRVIISLSAWSAPMAHFQCRFKGWIVKSINADIECSSIRLLKNDMRPLVIGIIINSGHPFPPLSQYSLGRNRRSHQTHNRCVEADKRKMLLFRRCQIPNMSVTMVSLRSWSECEVF